jgi:predicted phosphodiesterase
MNMKMKKSLAGLACGLAIAAGAVSVSAATGVLKSPYLIYPNVPSQMQVLWQDNNTQTDTITLYSDSGYQNQVCQDTSTEYNVTTNLTYGHQHTYTFGNTVACGALQTNTMYYYTVNDGTNTYNGSFMTAPNPTDTHVRFLAQGDSRSVPFQLDALMQLMTQFYQQPGNADYQRLSIANGDWVSTDGDKYWNAEWFQPTQTNVRAYTANVPINGVKGNHDNASGYSASFPKYYPFPYPTAAGAKAPRTGSSANDSDGNPYYSNLFWSFDYGPVHFTMIDEYSTMTVNSAQYNWVQSDLANTTKPWKILIYHEAAYSAGADGDNSGVRVYESLITQYNVDLVFSGHSHNYARCGAYNLTQAGTDTIALNVPHITSGGGGAPVYQVDQTNKGNYPHVITAWPSIEFMTFDVEGNTLTITSYQANGINQGASAPQTGLSYTMIEQTVLNHYPNVTPQVTATVSNFGYNHATKQYNGTVTLTNNGSALSGDLHLVLDGILNLKGLNTVGTGTGQLSNQYSTTNPKNSTMIANNPGAFKSAPAGVGLISNITLVNQTGSNNGEPMIKAPLNGNGLAAGASVTFPVTFSNPTNGPITFNPIILNELPGE